MWSTFYGDLAFDSKKFSNPKELVRNEHCSTKTVMFLIWSKQIATLHSKGFKVMLWIVPFCDQNATVYQEGSDHHYWVMESNDSGKLSPVGVKWWSNKEEGSAVLDVTNPHAVRWFVKRLQNFANEFGIDGFKLDAGEIEYIPPPALQNIYYYDEEALGNGSQLLRYTQLYSSIVDEVSNHAEVRAAWQHQDTSQLLRVMDLDSKWGHDNGLEAMISRVLLFSTIGYRYTLPDMIGGNGYGPGETYKLHYVIAI